MKSLYESILGSNSADLRSTIWNKTKPVIDGVLNAGTEFPILWFLEGNNLRLDKDTVKKIVNKLKKALPEGALFGSSYGVRQIAKQYVEHYGSVKFTNPKYAYYTIEIEYARRTDLYRHGISTTTLDEYLIYLTEDYIYALDIPETKSILAELDDHFAKYVTQDEVKLTDTYKMKSNIGGKYRVYSFKDLMKEFIDRK